MLFWFFSLWWEMKRMRNVKYNSNPLLAQQETTNKWLRFGLVLTYIKRDAGLKQRNVIVLSLPNENKETLWLDLGQTVGSEKQGEQGLMAVCELCKCAQDLSGQVQVSNTHKTIKSKLSYIIWIGKVYFFPLYFWIIFLIVGMFSLHLFLSRFISPCKSLCESVRDSCAPIMSCYGYPWPEILRCDKYPADHLMCISSITNTTVHTTGRRGKKQVTKTNGRHFTSLKGRLASFSASGKLSRLWAGGDLLH